MNYSMIFQVFPSVFKKCLNLMFCKNKIAQLIALIRGILLSTLLPP